MSEKPATKEKLGGCVFPSQTTPQETPKPMIAAAMVSSNSPLAGQAYEYGRGVSRNYVEAARWYRMAADRGQVEAQFLRGRMYERGYGVPLDTVLAYVWFTLAANNTATLPRPQDVEARRLAAQRRTTVASG